MGRYVADKNKTGSGPRRDYCSGRTHQKRISLWSPGVAEQPYKLGSRRQI